MQSFKIKPVMDEKLKDQDVLLVK
ncbi:hypothetical protein EZS27_040645, partial [termite gut metagenome]